jgi:hypothetical protein
VHVLLTLYLLPAVLAVLVLGGLLVILEALAGWIEAGFSHGRATLSRILAAGGDSDTCILREAHCIPSPSRHHRPPPLVE